MSDETLNAVGTTEKFPPPILSVPPQNDLTKPNMTLESIIQERRELAMGDKKGDVVDIGIIMLIGAVALMVLLFRR